MLSMMLVTSGLYFSPVNLTSQVEAAAQNLTDPSAKAFDQKVIARISAERIYKDIHFFSETLARVLPEQRRKRGLPNT